MPSRLIVWGVAQTIEMTVRARGLVDLKANPTLATGDFTLTKDGGTAENLAPTVTPASGTRIAVPLTAAQSEATRLTIVGIDQTNPKEWEDAVEHLHTQLADGGVVGKITSGTPSTTTFISTQLTGASTDHYKFRWVRFLSGNAKDQVGKISAFNSSTDTVTLDASFPLQVAPAVGDVFEVL